jgi:CRP-like cAMP-binding protein
VRTLQPGVWVELDGVVGRIVKTNWRETRIRTRGGHMYIFPNARIAENRIHNFSEPTPLRRHEINVGASYSDAPDEVIAALKEATRNVPEVRRSPAPEAMVTEFQDYGINYRLFYWTTELHRDLPISGHINRNIWYQFKRRGIEIPFPMSDKLLNDFMAVVYNQRKLMPHEEDVAAGVKDLLDSDLCTEILVDAEGDPLLSADDLAQVAPLVRRQPYTSGEILCRQGDDGDSFWVVARGKLRGEVKKDGQVAATFELGKGAVVGEMSLLTGVPRSATLLVAESAQLLEFGPEAFAALLGLHEDLPARLSELAADRAARNREALEELARQRENGGMVQLEQKGILKRLLRMMGRRPPGTGTRSG